MKIIYVELLKHPSYDNFKPVMKNYIAFSLPSKCWNKVQNAAYNQVVNELDKAIDLVDNLDSKIRIILIPPGWSFPI